MNSGPSVLKQSTPTNVETSKLPRTDSHLTLQQQRQVVEACSDVRVVRAQQLLVNSQRALV